MNRQTDENLYQPKIHSQRIRELHSLREISGIPMTTLVDTAIREFVEKKGMNHIKESNQNEIDAKHLDSLLARAHQDGYEDGIRYIWLNVVDPLLEVNVALNRGEKKVAIEQMRALDSWLKQHIYISKEYERNRVGETKRD